MRVRGLPGHERNGTEIVNGITLAGSRTSDFRAVAVDLDRDGRRPILTTPRDKAPMWVTWLRFSLAIPSGDLGYYVEFGGELIDQRDIDRREREAVGRGRSVRYLTRTVGAADLAERAAWVLPIIERFRPPYIETGPA